MAVKTELAVVVVSSQFNHYFTLWSPCTACFELSLNIPGTTANVSVKLSGEEDGASGGVRHLCRPGSFQRGSRDVFVVATDRSLGRLGLLTVWHDNTGTSPGWYLSRISVRDLQTGDWCHFIADTWLTLSTLGDHSDIEKQLQRIGKNNT